MRFARRPAVANGSRNKARIRGSLEQTVGQIRAFLERQARQRARIDFFSALELRFAVEYRCPEVQN